MKFVLISVEGFQEVPVVCKKNYGNILAQGAVYTRPRSGRPCSEPVSNYAEMRELLDLAVEHGVAKFLRTQSIARKAQRADTQLFSDQAKMPFSSDDVLLNIESRGHWEISIRPLAFEKERIPSLAEAERLIRDCQVSFRRGSSFPMVSNTVKRGLDFIESSLSSAAFGFHEVWRFYQSGQFILYLGLFEDWSKGTGVVQVLQPGTALSIILTLYTLTEIYEFAARLAEHGMLHPEASINVNLVRTKDRTLTFWGEYRHGVLFDHYTGAEESLPRELPPIQADTLVAERSELAFQHFQWIMERFGFDAKAETFRPDQEKFIMGQL